MNPDVPQEELLSAYLDGELTDTERAAVERLLADSPQARQLLEELRALSSTLKALPRHKLGEDISPQVLRLAEREMLLGKPEAPRPAAAPQESRLRRMLSRRALVWSGLAVAVAIVLMISDLRQSERRVAVAPATAPKSGEAPNMQAVPPADKPKEEQAGREARPSEPPAIAAAGVPAPAASADRSRQSKPLVLQEPLDLLVKTGTGTHDSSSAGARADKMSVDEVGASAGPQANRADSEQRGTAAVTSESAVAAPPQFADGVLVVQCDVKPEAARKQAFAQLLTANQIAWEESPQQPQPAVEKKKQPKKKSAAGRSVKEAETGGVTGKDSSGGEDLELVYVEAAADRIEATLNQLAAQPEKFSAVSVESVPGIQSPLAYGPIQRREADLAKSKPPAQQLGQSVNGSVGAAGLRQLGSAGDMRGNVQSAALGRAQRIAVHGTPSVVRSQLLGQLEKKPAVQLTPAQTLQEPAKGQEPAAPPPASGREQSPAMASQPAGPQQINAVPMQQQMYRVLFVLRVVGPEAQQRRAGAAKQEAAGPADAPARPEAK